MSDFKELVKNLYTSKNRELTPEKFDYIQKTYSNGKEQEFVKNFYATIGEDLTEEKLTYISDTYLKKKDTPSPPSATPSRLPKISEQVSPLQQGANIVGGGVIGDISKTVPKGSIKEAALADKKKNESYLGALWNNVVGSAARLAGGAARATYQFSGNPVIQMERELLDKAGKAIGKNLLAAKEKEYADVVKGVVERGRTSASSKEYEQKLAQGFDVTDGVGLSDLKGVGAMIPQFIADMGLAVGTGGGSFAIQGYDDALSMVDEMPKGSNISEGTRVAFGVGGALVVGALEKLGLDNLIKNPAAKKYVTAKILKEATDELVKKGVKVTADQFEKTVIDKASKLTAKELGKIVAKRGVKSGVIEGGTEAIQEGGMDLLKLAANKIEGKEIFNEEEMKDTAAKRYLNSFVAGGILGGIGGSVASRVQNTEAAIKDKLSKAKTVEDIDSIVAEINENVADGTMTEEEANDVLPIVQNFVDVSQKVPAELSGKNKVQAVDLISEREKLAEQIKKIEEDKAVLDPSFHPLYEGDVERIQERVDEINKELAELAKPENNVEEVIQQPIEVSAKPNPIDEQSIAASQKWVKDLYSLPDFTRIQDKNGNVYDIKDSKIRKLTLDKEGNIVDTEIIHTDRDIHKRGSYANPEFFNEGYKVLPEQKIQQIPDENIQQPIEQPELVEAIRVEQEPEAKEGTKVVTLSGMDENERVKVVEERRKSTKLNDKEILHRDFVDLAQRASKARGNEKRDLQGQIRQKIREVNAKAGEEVYRYDGERVRKKTKSKKKGERFMPISGTSKDFAGRAIKEDAVVLFDRSPDFVQKYEELADSPNITSLQVDSGNGVTMNAEQIESALQDIADGIPSVQADNLLNALEEGFNRGYFDLRGKDIGQDRVQASVEDFIGVQQEEVGQPMDEVELQKYLEEQAELPTEEEEDLNDLINQYEQQPQQIDISGKVQSPNPTSEKRSSPEIQPTKEGKGNGSPKAEVGKQPIGEAEPKQEDVEDWSKDVESTQKALDNTIEFKAKFDKHFEYVPIEQIEEYKEHDRSTEKKWGESDKTLDKLVKDIEENGIKTPITLQVDRNGKALIVEGNTRLAAAKRLGIKNIPVRVINQEFGDINKGKTKRIPRRRDVGEMKVFYPNVKLLDNDKSAAALGFDSIAETETKKIADAYHKDKKEGKSTKLIKAVENLLNKPKEQKAEAKPKEDVEDADVFYHSTNKDFEGFDDKKIGTNKDFGWFGLGHYFTSNKEESKYYGKNVIEINISKIKDKIYKAVLSNQSIKIPKSVFEYIEKNLKNFKDYELGTYDNFKVGNLIDKEGSKVFSDAFKNEGYLGVRVSGDANELVIFESKNIPKSEPKTPLEQQYEEASQKKGEKAQQKAKEKLISDNFDGIVAQLMTKNKIKRKC